MISTGFRHHRKRYQHPLIGLLLPWCIVGLMTYSFRSMPGPAAEAWHFLSASWFDATNQTQLAESHLAKVNSRSTPGLRVWRKELVRSAGMGSMLSGDFPEAIGYFSRAIESSKINGQATDYFACLYRGICYFKEGQVVKADTDWQRCIELYPERHDAYMAIGHQYLLSGKVVDASTYYKEVMKRSGQLGTVLVDIGDAWRWRGSNTLARMYYRQGLTNDPANVFCLLRLAEMALVMENDPARTIQLCNQIQRMMPQLTVASQLAVIAGQWSDGDTLPHFPAARFEHGNARHWKISPTKILFEFFRPDWKGW